MNYVIRHTNSIKLTNFQQSPTLSILAFFWRIWNESSYFLCVSVDLSSSFLCIYFLRRELLIVFARCSQILGSTVYIFLFQHLPLSYGGQSSVYPFSVLSYIHIPHVSLRCSVLQTGSVVYGSLSITSFESVINQSELCVQIFWTHARKYYKDPCMLSFTQRACSQARFFCVGVMYWGEYDACDVTLSVYPHRASLKNMPDHGANRTYNRVQKLLRQAV
jgi:hypothetical protein